MGVKNDTKVLGLDNLKDRFIVSENGKRCREAGLKGCKQSFGFLMFLRHLCRDFELAIEYSHLEFGRHVQAGDTNLGVMGS